MSAEQDTPKFNCGHPRDEANTRRRKGATGQAVCRICENRRRQRLRKAAKARRVAESGVEPGTRLAYVTRTPDGGPR